MVSKLKAVLFDIDGTLVDSNDAHAAAWVEALARRGIAVPFEKVRRMIGMGGDKLLAEAAGVDRQSELGEELVELHTELFAREHLPELRAFPKARELVDAVDRLGLTPVAASSATDEELQALLKVADVSWLIKNHASSDHADRSKPDPDIVEAALEEVRAQADEALMIGDTPYDLEAARRAGVGFLAVLSGGWPRGAFGGALEVYEGPADLLARLGASPIASRR